MPPLRSPLYPLHEAAGATWTEFGGWEMPLRYDGIVAEHHAVRRDVGVFDVSHMGKILVEGPGAWDFLMRLSANDLPREEGRARYTHLVDERGRIVDDVIITSIGETRYFVVCNAGPRKRVLSWFQASGGSVTLRDVTFDHLCLAVQGPKSARVLQMLTSADLEAVRPFRSTYVDLLLSARVGTSRESDSPAEVEGWGPLAPERSGDGCLLTRTGYTGEDGFELFPHRSLGEFVWKALLGAGRDAGIRPVGLGARDTLRLEKGYLLSGQDFDGRQSPLETSSEWLVKWDHDFLGREALRRQKERGDYGRLVGLRVEDRGVPRHGHEVVRGTKVVGTVTSGTMSPSLKTGIALAYVGPDVAAPGTELAITIRDRPIRAVVTKLPFL